MTNRKKAEWLVLCFFAVTIAIVFQQILTDMTESGIASGGPYDNAAAYPRAVAVIIGVLMLILLMLRFVPVFNHNVKQKEEAESKLSLTGLKRSILLLLIFALYLWALGFLGYYISTPLMIMGIMILSGLKKPLEVIPVSILISFFLAFMFEYFLKIVLPGGILRLNIPW
jgi:putative tricarboxylic transport membrane protein